MDKTQLKSSEKVVPLFRTDVRKPSDKSEVSENLPEWARKEYKRWKHDKIWIEFDFFSPEEDDQELFDCIKSQLIAEELFYD
jgi:hypothetical protein